MSGNNLELITWSNTFSCGIKLIDDQHKKLLALINDIYNHVSGSEEDEARYFEEVIQEIFRYIKLHFETEEKIMIAAKFEGYDEHKTAHDSFRFAIVDNFSDFITGKRFRLYSFTDFLKNWALSHIAVLDKEHFAHLRKKLIREQATEK